MTEANPTLTMSLRSIPGIESLLKKKVVDERKSYETVSQELKSAYPSLTRGLSARSIRRYCSDHGIQSTSRLTDAQMDRVVAAQVAKVYTVLNWDTEVEIWVGMC